MVTKKDFIFFGVISILFWIFFIHPDIMETSNHSYLLLDGIFNGHLRDFYQRVELHNNDLYYINNANYNIFVYFLFAIWQLPVYIIQNIFSLPMNENFYFIWSKGLSVLFYFGCAYVIFRISLLLGLDNSSAGWAGFAFLLNPVAFFSPMVMGQYDTICLFFLLVSLYYYINDDMPRFTLIISISFLAKFFSVFIFLPLLLLKEKRFIHIIKHCVLAVLPLALSSVLFRGTSSGFLGEMASRLIEHKIASIPLFPSFFSLLLIFCFLRKGETFKKDCISIAFFVFSSLFLLIDFHPQWVILFIPFWVLLVATQKNKQLYYYMSILLSTTFLLYSFMVFPRAVEWNLLWFGLFRLIGVDVIVIGFTSFSEFISSFSSVFANIAAASFSVVLLSVLIFRLPFSKNGLSLADKGIYHNPKDSKRLLWMCYAIGISFWMVVTFTGIIIH